MDSLAAHGVRFTRAYSPNPLCMPMRTSMITGLYPHQTGIQTNDREGFDPDQARLYGKALSGCGV